MGEEQEDKKVKGIKLPFEIGDKFNSMLRKKLTDAVVDGFGSLFMSEELLGRITDDLRLPRELLGTVAKQTEKARRGLAEILKKEVRRFLEGIDISSELQKMLASMVLEVKTEIRFVPSKDGMTPVSTDKKTRFSFRRTKQE